MCLSLINFIIIIIIIIIIISWWAPRLCRWHQSKPEKPLPSFITAPSHLLLVCLFWLFNCFFVCLFWLFSFVCLFVYCIVLTFLFVCLFKVNIYGANYLFVSLLNCFNFLLRVFGLYHKQYLLNYLLCLFLCYLLVVWLVVLTFLLFGSLVVLTFLLFFGWLFSGVFVFV